MPLDFFNVHIGLRQIIEKIKRKINFQTANEIKPVHISETILKNMTTN